MANAKPNDLIGIRALDSVTILDAQLQKLYHACVSFLKIQNHGLAPYRVLQVNLCGGYHRVEMRADWSVERNADQVKKGLGDLLYLEETGRPLINMSKHFEGRRGYENERPTKENEDG